MQLKEVKQLLQDAIAEQGKTPQDAYNHSSGILHLAEALAWLTSPNQPHGGAVQVRVTK